MVCCIVFYLKKLMIQKIDYLSKIDNIANNIKLVVHKDKQVLLHSCKWFDVYHTLSCGQIFRYFVLQDNVYLCISKDKWCVLQQQDEQVLLITHEVDYFKTYFDLHTDYFEIEKYLSQYTELFEPIKLCKGLHILRQDLLETIISFIVSANNNIGRIKNTLNMMCENFGQAFEFEIDKKLIKNFCFPTIDKLSKISIQEWKKFGAGYRAEYLYETCQYLFDSDILYQLENCDYATAYKLLLSLKGIGPKVADCIALFGLSHRKGFPVDTWVFKGLRTEELNTKSKVYEYYTNRYGEYGGYAQQYIFYYNRTLGRK